jgi:hypothetical protein
VSPVISLKKAVLSSSLSEHDYSCEQLVYEQFSSVNFRSTIFRSSTRTATEGEQPMHCLQDLKQRWTTLFYPHAWLIRWWNQAQHLITDSQILSTRQLLEYCTVGCCVSQLVSTAIGSSCRQEPSWLWKYTKTEKNEFRSVIA